MEYIELGNSGLKVSRICFGCAPMGGHDYGEVDDAASIKAAHCAIENGINFFDAAAIYGFGRAESVLAEVLVGKRDKVVLATKGGLRKTEGKIIPDLSPAHLRSDIENSLQRLRTDRIDLYQLHYFDPKTPYEQTVDVLKEYLRAGKIRCVGLSNFLVEQVKDFAKCLPVACLQLPYNPLQRALEENGVPELCRTNKVGLITYSSLARGYLSGKTYSSASFVGSDTRGRSTYFAAETENKKKPVLNAVRSIAVAHNKTPGQVALRWLLGHDFVTSAIVGFKTEAQVADALPACHWNLSDAEMAEVDRVSAVFKKEPLY